jgi:diphthine-ammonia ligase
MMWSGGKDSYLAYQEIISKGFKVLGLLNYTFENTDRKPPSKILGLLNHAFKNLSRATRCKILDPFNHTNRRAAGNIPHEISPAIIAMQAQAMEIPIVQWEVTPRTFEDQLKKVIRKLEPSHIKGIVWGVEEGEEVDSHKDLLHQVCDELGIKLVMPLRGMSEEQILAYFMEKNCEAIITVVDSNFFGNEWLGRKVDNNFLRELRRLSRERGIPSGCIEYHTLVIDAPLLKKRLKVLQSKKVSKNGYSVLDISQIELVGKTEKHKDKNS